MIQHWRNTDNWLGAEFKESQERPLKFADLPLTKGYRQGEGEFSQIATKALNAKLCSECEEKTIPSISNEDVCSYCRTRAARRNRKPKGLKGEKVK